MVDPALVDRHVWLAGLVDPAQGERVVDLGCGEGVALELLLTRLGDSVAVGVDLDVEALQALVSVSGPGPRARLVAADLAGPLPLADRSVDAVFCPDVLELLPDADAPLLEVWRVLRPGAGWCSATPTSTPRRSPVPTSG